MKGKGGQQGRGLTPTPMHECVTNAGRYMENLWPACSLTAGRAGASKQEAWMQEVLPLLPSVYEHSRSSPT